MGTVRICWSFLVSKQRLLSVSQARHCVQGTQKGAECFSLNFGVLAWKARSESNSVVAVIEPSSEESDGEATIYTWPLRIFVIRQVNTKCSDIQYRYL